LSSHGNDADARKAVAAATALQSAARTFNGESFLTPWKRYSRMKEDLNMQTKNRTLTKLVAISALLLWAGGCRGGRTPAPVTPEKAEVPPPSPAPTVTLTAEPDNIQSGNSTTLSWNSQNASDLELGPAVGKVQATGSTSVTLRDSTTFTLTATGPGGTETAIARVTVTPLPSPPAIKPVPEDEGGLLDKNAHDAYFDFDKADIRPDAEQALTGDANFLKEHQSIKFTLEGLCDERGSEEYNLALGDRRATTAKEFLVNAGVSADRINTISYGKSRPVCAEQTEECWQKNRRAHFHQGGESQ
jgi:peptidoglycan-associated lipoprotein